MRAAGLAPVSLGGAMLDLDHGPPALAGLRALAAQPLRPRLRRSGRVADPSEPSARLTVTPP